MVFQELPLPALGKGTHEFTAQVASIVRRSCVSTGVAHVYCQHTSASLIIMENADSSARRDLEAWVERLVPQGDPHFEHVLEGPDDMPSHIKMVLTRTAESIPVCAGELLLGAWQGLFLWEHRTAPQRRHIVVTLMGD
ncbi:MAG: YjbQ family protein [Verrucomicrobia bacterium]|nr:MAG: YjbQ family protein [Verrucomicrobiota bacterium]